MKSYVLKQPGEVIDNFRIDTVAGYSNGEPIYSVTCGICATSGVTVTHDEFRKGRQRCSSSTHFAAVRDSRPAMNLPPESEPESEHEPIAVDQYVQGLRVGHEAQSKLNIAIARDQWVQYIQYGIVHGWNLDKMLDIKDWLRVSLEQREQILEKQRSGSYDKKKETIA